MQNYTLLSIANRVDLAKTINIMKLKYILVLCITLTISYYLYQDKSLFITVKSKVHQIVPELNQSTLYKWQNNKGEWQITDKPPNKGVSFITITSQDQINVMPSPASEKKK